MCWKPHLLHYLGELLAASATISDGDNGVLSSFRDCHWSLLINEMDAPVSTIHSLSFPLITVSTVRVFFLLAEEMVDSLIFESLFFWPPLCVTLLEFGFSSHLALQNFDVAIFPTPITNGWFSQTLIITFGFHNWLLISQRARTSQMSWFLA